MAWTDQKHQLISLNYLDPAFAEAIELTVKRELAAASDDPHAGDEYQYKARLVHQHTASVSQLLDRVLSYRREARDLEILAVKVAMDYQLFDITTRLDEDLDLARLGVEVRQQSFETQTLAANAFGSGQALQEGFAAGHKGRAKELALELQSVEKQAELIRKRYAAQRDYQAAYRAKHQEPGNAHNYAERAHRLTQLFLQDLREAYAKSKAIALGIDTIWGAKFPVPTPDTTVFIDDLVDWNRDVVRFIEFLTQGEVQVNLVVPLVQPWIEGGKSILSADQFAQSLSNGGKTSPIIFKFDLAETHFAHLNVRVLEVGLSYGNAIDILDSSGIDRNATRDNYARLRARVTAPPQHYADGSKEDAPEFFLGSVGLYGSNTPVDSCSAGLIRYLDPVGHWEISIDPLAVYKDASQQIASLGMDQTAPISDIKLH
jgi:hypothetical protein